ncbi:MAG: DUF1924 domain-containing protein [Alphaproteobacteria bacterium]|nr:MAG: DUF1924 domain-containing protein [Alphaproteobacteria bacterium]
MKNKERIIAICLSAIFISLPCAIFANETILKELEKEVRASGVKFIKFDTTAGEKIFRGEKVHSSGEKISCMTCHTPDPKKSGMTRANKIIQPMAPIINPERFTDIAKVQKWFKRNCNDVFERECAPQEKGDFIKFMMSIK